jgi:hypothetical protein
METYRIKLSLQDLKVLQENLKDETLKEKVDSLSKTFGEPNRQATLNFNEIELDKILDCLTDLLFYKGLTESDELNGFGYYLESLIDTFSIE